MNPHSTVCLPNFIFRSNIFIVWSVRQVSRAAIVFCRPKLPCAFCRFTFVINDHPGWLVKLVKKFLLQSVSVLQRKIQEIARSSLPKVSRQLRKHSFCSLHHYYLGRINTVAAPILRRLYSSSKNKTKHPIYFNTNYHTEMKLVPFIMD